MRIVIVAIVIILGTSCEVSRADWVDDWVNGAVASYTGPSYYDSGQRGYVSFGSLSLRNGFLNDQVASFQPPRLQLGCGGIDLFLGGFHFMDFDYLVQQFQNIISAAPAFAFEYALRAISEQSGTIMDSLKSISDLLNQTQFNSCAKARQLGILMASQGDNMYKGIGEKLKSAIGLARFRVDENSLYYKTLNTIFGNGGEPSPSDLAKINDGCPSYFMDVLREGSLVRYIHNAYFPGTGNDSLEDLIRGYLGDVTFEKRNNFWFAHRIPGCGGPNSEKSFKAFVEGDYLAKNLSHGIDGDCYSPSTTKIKDKVASVLQNAYNSILNNTSIGSSDVNWLKMLPLPILSYMKQLYMYHAPSQAVQTMAEPAAYGFGYSIISVIYGEVSKSIGFVEENKVRACQSSRGKQCYLCEQDQTISKAMRRFKENIYREATKAQAVWMSEQAELSRTNDIIMVLKDVSKQVVKARLATGHAD